MVQLFVTRNRLTAVSLIYNSVYAVVGGMLPFALFYATERLSFACLILGICGADWFDGVLCPTLARICSRIPDDQYRFI